MTAASVTALVTVSTGVRERMGEHLRQYGANMIVTSSSGRDFDASWVEDIRSASAHIKAASPHVYGAAAVQGGSVEIIGMGPDNMKGYRIKGRTPISRDEIMIGANLKNVLHVDEAGRIWFDGRAEPYTVTGVFERGTEEDSSIVMPLEAAQTLLNTKGISAVFLNGDTRYIADIEAAITTRFPSLQVKTLRQVAVAEERLLGRIELLMLIVSMAVLLTSVVSLGSTMGATVLERMEEIGLMKAIGADHRHIRRFFIAEAALAGLVGAVSGCIVGILAAEAVSQTAFGKFIPVHPGVPICAIAVGVLVSVLSAYFPVRDAVRVVPAVILRGE